MLNIGKINALKLLPPKGREIYLEAPGGKKLLLVGKLPSKTAKAGDWLDAFVYVDSGGFPVATLDMPKAQVDEFAWLKVVAVNYYGAFMDWGLGKELILPFSEQNLEPEPGQHYLVRLFLDERGRVAASAKIEQFLSDTVEADDTYKPGQKVGLLIAGQTDLGYKVIVDNRYWGLLYANEVFEKLKKGQALEGYVKQVREDLKIDLSLQPRGYAKIDPLAEIILAKLAANGGILEVGDKTPPEEIRRLFGTSKKAFKQAIGGLYKKQLIVIEDDKIKQV